MRLQGRWNAEDLKELLMSPPFRQQVDSFTYVRDLVFNFVLDLANGG